MGKEIYILYKGETYTVAKQRKEKPTNPSSFSIENRTKCEEVGGGGGGAGGAGYEVQRRLVLS